MKLHTLLVVGFALTLTGCGEKQQAVTEAGDEAQTTATEVVAAAAENERWQNDAFLAHMHRHAEKLDDLNFALADGDLEAAMTPAYWLSRHESVDDIPSEWMPYMYRMRTEAQAVEAAPDLATARAAAERITVECQGCHAAVGVSTE